MVFRNILIGLILILLLQKTFGQEKDRYIIGEEEKLQIIVHIWGEVNRPGEYLVPDGTNVLELISRAGGPTQYSNLSKVTLTRAREYHRNCEKEGGGFSSDSSPGKTQEGKRVIKINLRKYLEGDSYQSLPVLQPGDVVRVHRNIWYKWQAVIRVASQVAIILQAWYWFNRIE